MGRPSHIRQRTTSSMRAGRRLALLITFGLLAVSTIVPATADSTAANDPELDWAMRAGGSGFDAGNGIAVDADGNSLVVGNFTGTVTFGEGDQAVTLEASLIDETFLASYDAAGRLRWAVQTRSASNITAESVAVDDTGNSVVTGAFQEEVTLGQGDDAVTLEANDTSGMFVASYDATGRLRWAQRGSGVNSVYGRDAAMDSAGNTFVTGSFWGSATFGEGEEAVTLEAPQEELEAPEEDEAEGASASPNAFLASYDPHGQLRWALLTATTPEQSYGSGVASDPTGNSVVTGQFSGSATFGEGSQAVTLSGDRQAFVASYDPNGTLRWATQATSSADTVRNATPAAVAVDAAGNSSVTGWFSGTVTLGEDDAATTLTSIHESAFVASYDFDGRLRWASSAGGADHGDGLAFGEDVALDDVGNTVVTGNVYGPVTFGEGDDTVTLDATHDVAPDVFVAAYGPDGRLRWAILAVYDDGSSWARGHGVAVDRSGSIMVTGAFAGSATFGEGDHAVTLESADKGDVFVARYSTDGEFAPPSEPIWLKCASGGAILESPAPGAAEIGIPGAPENESFGAGLFTAETLAGDFEIEVDFDLVGWPEANGVRVGLVYLEGASPSAPAPHDAGATGSVERTSFGDPTVDFPGQPREVYLTNFEGDVRGIIETEDEGDLSGRLRLVRNGDVVSGYRWDGSGWVLIAEGETISEDWHVGVAAWSSADLFAGQAVEVEARNLRISGGTWTGQKRDCHGSPLGPEVTVAPVSGPAGTIFLASGLGFTENSTVTSFLEGPREFDPITLATDERGAYADHPIDSTGFPAGTYSHWAVDDETGAQSNIATFTVADDADSRYVAMGDSFQSGHGIGGSYLDGPGDRDCKRHSAAYPKLLQDRDGIPEALDFVACSGATIQDFYEDQEYPNQRAQLLALGPDVSLVTVGIGGNDIGFADVVTDCFKYWKDCMDDEYRRQVEQRIVELGPLINPTTGIEEPGPLSTLYREIRDRAPHAELVVLGYPRLFPDPPQERYSDTFLCRFWIIPGCMYSFDIDEQAWMNEMTDLLNVTIERAVYHSNTNARVLGRVNERLFYDVFDGHELARSDSAELAVRPPVIALEFDDFESMHPNRLGHELIEEMLHQKLNEQPPTFTVLPGATTQTEVTVESDGVFTPKSSRFLIDWGNSDVQLTVEAPDGTLYGRDHGAPDGVMYGRGDSFETVTIRSPIVGVWTVAMFGADVSPDGTDVELLAGTIFAPPEPPVATLTATLDQNGLTVEASASQPGQGDIVDFYWNFGDGTEVWRDSPEPVSHTYDKPGTYRARLMVVDEHHQRGFATADIAVVVECRELIADGGDDSTDAGQVCTLSDDETLLVSYATTDDWHLDESHVVASWSAPGADKWMEEGWQTPRGNPVPGSFPWNAKHDPESDTDFVYLIPLSTVPVSSGEMSELFVAAHAHVQRFGRHEGSWADGLPFVDQGNWATYFTHRLSDS